MRPQQMIVFRKRARRREWNGFRYSLWVSTDGRFAVERSRWTGRAGLPDVWRAFQRDGGDWRLLLNGRTGKTTHRTRAAAERTCRAAARQVRACA